MEVEVKRSNKWVEMMADKKFKDYFGHNAKSREKMINRIYKGVPNSVRGKLWHILLGVEVSKAKHPNVYQQMRSIARRHSPDIRQVSCSNLPKADN